ncbi:MAG TPA: nucleotidyltransferase [Gaiella sp.]|nr:nucleotidyltransferase [Gaiella sp.]
MGTQPNDTFLELVETLKRSAATLRDAKVPFLLGGGLAAWARGGPPTDHDVDLLVRERDVERAQQALAAAGFRIEHPPEGWLVKAWDGDVLVDLIFRPTGGAVGDEHFERATVLEVAAQSLPVASIEDVLAAKLLALTEQEPDYGQVLEIARSLREQIDWEVVRSQVDRTPFGAAFFTLVERLGIVQDPVGSAS